MSDSASFPSTAASPKATHAPAPAAQEQYTSRLEDFELEDTRPPFILNGPEMKLLGIAGVRILRPPPGHTTLTAVPSRPQVGFFLDGKLLHALCEMCEFDANARIALQRMISSSSMCVTAALASRRP